MDSTKYKYDVAFSFLKEDEGIAVHLNDLLKGRYSTFVYSDRQKELAGRDGEKLFNAVFQNESRTVIVLYRENWGKTPWTRIEETAIRNRIYIKGYEFVTIVSLDEKTKVPDWLPKVRLYVGFKKYGLEATAAIIDSRIIEQGGVEHVESPSEKAERIDREVKRERDRRNFLNSQKGVADSYSEYDKLKQSILDEFNKIKEQNPSWHFNVQKNDHNQFQLISYGFTIGLGWHTQLSNSLDGSYLYVNIYDGVFYDHGGHDPFNEPKKKFESKFDFGQNNFDELVWISKQDTSKKLTSSNLGQEIISRLLDFIKEDKLRE